jgi:hypothetical protein
MASSILVRAKNMLERGKQRAQRERREKTNLTALAAGAATGIGVTVAAAFADQKLGQGQQWKPVGGIPGVAMGGAAMLVPAFLTSKMPIVQASLVQGGMTALNLSLYRYLVEEGIEAGT